MNPRTGSAFLALFLTATAYPTFSQAPRDPDQARAAITALIRRAQEANNAGDVEAWVSLFADDAVYMPPNGPSVTTREGLVEAATNGFRNRAAIEIDPLEIQVHGDWAFARTHVSGSVTLQETGEAVQVDVKEIVLCRRQPGGAWKIARLINNSNLE